MNQNLYFCGGKKTTQGTHDPNQVSSFYSINSDGRSCELAPMKQARSALSFLVELILHY